MARPILILDQKKIVSLDDLRAHFVFQEVKANIISGKMVHWLEYNRFFEEADKIKNLDMDDNDAEQKILIALDFSEEQQKAYFIKKEDETKHREEEEVKHREEEEAKHKEDTNWIPPDNDSFASENNDKQIINLDNFKDVEFDLGTYDFPEEFVSNCDSKEKLRLFSNEDRLFVLGKAKKEDKAILIKSPDGILWSSFEYVDKSILMPENFVDLIYGEKYIFNMNEDESFYVLLEERGWKQIFLRLSEINSDYILDLSKITDEQSIESNESQIYKESKIIGISEGNNRICFMYCYTNSYNQNEYCLVIGEKISDKIYSSFNIKKIDYQEIFDTSVYSNLKKQDRIYIHIENIISYKRGMYFSCSLYYKNKFIQDVYLCFDLEKLETNEFMHFYLMFDDNSYFSKKNLVLDRENAIYSYDGWSSVTHDGLNWDDCISKNIPIVSFYYEDGSFSYYSLPDTNISQKIIKFNNFFIAILNINYASSLLLYSFDGNIWVDVLSMLNNNKRIIDNQEYNKLIMNYGPVTGFNMLIKAEFGILTEKSRGEPIKIEDNYKPSVSPCNVCIAYENNKIIIYKDSQSKYIVINMDKFGKGVLYC